MTLPHDAVSKQITHNRKSQKLDHKFDEINNE